GFDRNSSNSDGRPERECRSGSDQGRFGNLIGADSVAAVYDRRISKSAELLAHDFESRFDPFLAHYTVLFVKNENPRPLFRCFFGGVAPEIHDRNPISDFSQMRGCAVQLD